jgi:hypothetical protein
MHLEKTQVYTHLDYYYSKTCEWCTGEFQVIWQLMDCWNTLICQKISQPKRFTAGKYGKRWLLCTFFGRFLCTIFLLCLPISTKL